MPDFQFERRLADILRFYKILDELEVRVGGKRTLATADGRMDWPERGVYFFFETGEDRTPSGEGPRVVRIGTHALKSGAQATLWERLRQHRGTLRGGCPGGGNHRGSVFRKHIGIALIGKYPGCWPPEVKESWGKGSNAPQSVRERECPLEQAVSRHIRGGMSFLWLKVNDPPGPDGKRCYIERNAIALLSNYDAGANPVDPPSPEWLGRWAASEQIRRSGLWNVNHVAEDYDPGFLDVLQNYVGQM